MPDRRRPVLAALRGALLPAVAALFGAAVSAAALSATAVAAPPAHQLGRPPAAGHPPRGHTRPPAPIYDAPAQALLPGPAMLPPPALPQVASYVLMDATTGTVIAAKAPDLHWAPASLAKLMVADLTYRAIAAGRLGADRTLVASATAWRTGGSRMFLKPGQTVTVPQLLAGLIIDSGNDAAVVLAQTVGGSRADFVTMMNQQAAKLGLRNTHYTNVTGLPDPAMYTTARDVALLSRAIIDRYPAYLKISVRRHDSFNNIRQRSWNPVLFRDPTVDGLKTGRTDAAGHCIDATALRNGRRLIAVELGAPSWAAGTKAIEALLGYGYQFSANTTVATAGHPLGTLTDPRTEPQTVPVGAGRSLAMTLPVAAARTLTTRLVLDPAPKGGIARGAVVGQVVISAGGASLASLPAVALAPAHPAGFLTLLLRRVRSIL